MRSEIENRLTDSLKRREQDGLLRIPSVKSGLIDFASNDYLGFARSEELAGRIKKEYNDLDVQNGSTGSRLLTGNSQYALILEEELASYFKAEASLLFSSGYQANLGLLSCVPQKGDTVIYDELSHACIKDGIRLSFADRYTFKHNNLEDLERKLRRARGNKFVVVESIYSMDGDQCPLQEVVKLCEENDAKVIVDEAHSTGIYGDKGEGLVCQLALGKKVWARVHTFGKAMGIHGACVAGSQLLVDYLINYSRPFIYTTAPPIHMLASIKSSFSLLRENKQLNDQLSSKISLFKENMDFQRLIPSSSPIQAIVIPGNEEVKGASQQLEEFGFDVRPILSPTVKEGEERLRVCLHAFNSEEEIQGLTQVLKTII